ncbi:MAG: ExbD/TolR family protein [Planctomycetota bacterium]
MSELRRSHGARIQRLSDLTPLVDVALVLVVFFLLNYQAADDAAIPVELPAALSAEPIHAPRLQFAVLEDGTVLLDERPVALEAIAGVVGDATTAAIRADRRVAYGRVIAVQDALRSAGVERIYSATREPGVEEW